jgi:hypothetical protein
MLGPVAGTTCQDFLPWDLYCQDPACQGPLAWDPCAQGSCLQDHVRTPAPARTHVPRTLPCQGPSLPRTPPTRTT